MENEAGYEPHFAPPVKLSVMDNDAHVSNIFILPHCYCAPFEMPLVTWLSNTPSTSCHVYNSWLLNDVLSQLSRVHTFISCKECFF
jgi:hypothetical protein